MATRPTGSRVIPSNEYCRERWRNGSGWTRDIFAARAPDADGPGSADWAWRLSIAEIERDSPFSAFPGIDRELVLLGGNGLRLRFDDGQTQRLDPPHGRARFAGERTVTGEPVDGPVHGFNLMWRRDALDARLWHRPLVGPMLIFVDPGDAWAVHLIAGDAGIGGDAVLPPLSGGDTALLAAGASRARYVLEGGGAVLLARITPSPPPMG